MAKLSLTDDEKAFAVKYQFHVSESGSHYIVRDPHNKKLGGKGYLESGNLRQLFADAMTARTEAGISLPEEANPNPAPEPPKPDTAVIAPPEATGTVVSLADFVPTTKTPDEPDIIENAELDDSGAKTSKPKKESKPRDTHIMDMLYSAIIDGIQPGKVFDHLTKRGIPLKSATSAYTHAAIASRVVKCALAKGWKRPDAETATDEGVSKKNT